ncbi:Kinesin-4 AltName: Full=Kinesin-like protein D [Rhizoctonia solani AG-1 IB]|uniref:Rhizoctonia solani AG1-IB WGS project CAOJ00000000 data, isolate 7/3/14, contig 12113 n=1 Tax=Thanatephorus cucumeris (strain AG1-IB / isolate 7/3/14) TaxID=1108050 RepID=M5BXZ9_THACB|nr:Kinesin-4 AltName: Full=Kinesin-like protein D [Rhizoctonia solani AG-1 IB]
MWVHVPSSKWSGPTIQHKPFEGDFAFGPESTSEEVYERLVARPGVLDTVLGGGVGCVLAYGQTGSGKTYTISSLEEIISRDIFSAAESYASAHFPGSPTLPKDVFTMGISMYELLGNKATDLLDQDSKGVDIAEDKFGGIQVSAKVVSVTNASELANMVSTAASHRRTSATLKNETSSRIVF